MVVRLLGCGGAAGDAAGLARLIGLVSLVSAVGLAGVSGCVSPEDVEELQKGQKEILSKLEKDILPKLEKIENARVAAAAPARPGQPDASAVYAFPVGDSPSKGPSDAWVTIVEISEFQCPFCQRVTPTLKQVRDTYGDDVRVVFKHNPLSFHNNAKPAAKAAECAREQGKFWEMHDKLFENQRELDAPKLEEYAKQVGTNVDQWKTCFASTKHEDRINGDQRLANQFGARGTPGFFINGRFLSGAQPFESFKVLIDEELKKAKESGIAKKDYYAKAVMEKGKSSL
jgi:protein-disulfide isomerase